MKRRLFSYGPILAPPFDSILLAAFTKKGTSLSPVPFKRFLTRPFNSLAKMRYVVPLGIIRGVLSPFTIAWKICARLVKFALVGESAGHPPELSE